ncbi:MAG: exo-alpha-sialidase [Nibricoccus sp.]
MSSPQPASFRKWTVLPFFFGTSPKNTQSSEQVASQAKTAHSFRLSRLNRALLIAVTLVVVVLTAHTARFSNMRAPKSIENLSARLTSYKIDAVPFFNRSWVSPAEHTPAAHCSSICKLPSGDLLAIWYGGTREGAADVSLFTSRLPAGSSEWTPPERTVDRALAENELDRTVKKVGNAVIFPDRAGNLLMVYVSVSIGGWSGSALNVKVSRDEGRTWSESRRLTCNPFLNLSSLVRNKPIYTSDGRIGLPIYHEMAMKFPQMLWLTPAADGTVADYRIRNLSSENGLIQPSLVPLGGDRILMLLRDRRAAHSVHTAYSDDNGWTWSQAQPSNLPNPNAAVDALRLRDGRILMVYNHASSGRENLRLAVSSDGGHSWKAGAVLENAERQEFSYPNLVEDSQGRIHLTYTWERKRIRHVTFNLAWLDQPSLAQAESRP